MSFTENDQLNDAKAKVRADYGENRKIADGNYDKSLAVRCVNGTFVGRRRENIIAYKGILSAGDEMRTRG